MRLLRDRKIAAGHEGLEERGMGRVEVDVIAETILVVVDLGAERGGDLLEDLLLDKGSRSRFNEVMKGVILTV